MVSAVPGSAATNTGISAELNALTVAASVEVEVIITQLQLAGQGDPMPTGLSSGRSEACAVSAHRWSLVANAWQQQASHEVPHMRPSQYHAAVAPEDRTDESARTAASN